MATSLNSIQNTWAVAKKHQHDFVTLLHTWGYNDATIRTSLMSTYQEPRMNYSSGNNTTVSVQYEFPHFSKKLPHLQTSSQNESDILNFKLMLSIQSLSWLLKSDYCSFANYQDSRAILSRQHFTWMSQLYFRDSLTTKDDIQTLVVLCVLCSIGKAQKFQSFVHSVTRQCPFNGNHAVLLLLTHETSTGKYQYLPLINGLTYNQITIITECLQILVFFDLARFVNGEGSYWNLVVAKATKQTAKAGLFVLQQQLLEVFGSNGHISYFSCVKFTDDLYWRYFTALTSFQQIFLGSMQPQDHTYIKIHTDVMARQTKWIQDLNIPETISYDENQLFLRLMSMAQVSDRDSARSIFSAYKALTEVDKHTLLSELTKHCRLLPDRHVGIVLRHSSLVLSNIVQRARIILQETAFKVVFTIFARTLKVVEAQRSSKPHFGHVEVDVSMLNTHANLWTSDFRFIGNVESLRSILDSLSLDMLPVNISMTPSHPQQKPKYIVLYKLNSSK